MHQYIGSCLALNLNYSGCCDPFLSPLCSNNGCYCDQVCHIVGDCCSDVGDIGCYPISIGKTNEKVMSNVIINSLNIFILKSI